MADGNRRYYPQVKYRLFWQPLRAGYYLSDYQDSLIKAKEVIDDHWSTTSSVTPVGSFIIRYP